MTYNATKMLIQKYIQHFSEQSFTSFCEVRTFLFRFQTFTDGHGTVICKYNENRMHGLFHIIFTIYSLL